MTRGVHPLRLIIVVLIAGALLLNGVSAQSQSAPHQYTFAYITRSKNDHLILNLIQPANTANTSQQIEMPETSVYVFDTTPSPNGHYVLLTLMIGNEAPNTVLRLLDLKTGQIHDLALFYVSDDWMTAEQDFKPLWSPDSCYVAIIIPAGQMKVATANEAVGTAIYDTVSGKLLTLPAAAYSSQTNRKTSAYALLWSPDSARLLVSYNACTVASDKASPLCGPKLAIFSFPDVKLQKTLEVNGPIYDPCNFTWSPDGKYVGFQAVCPVMADPYPFEELFTWNIDSGKVDQITHYTVANAEGMTNPTSDDLTSFHMDYTPAWLKGPSPTLITGVKRVRNILGVLPDEFLVRTEAYGSPTATPIVLSNEYAEGWAVNPANNLVAYSSRGIILEKNVQDDSYEEVIRNRSLRIASFNGSTLTPLIAEQGLVCALRWSPDGKLLAVMRPVASKSDYEACKQVSSVSFIDPARNGETNFAFATDTFDLQIIGWVEVNTPLVPRFPNGTPTPIPTPGPVG